MSAVDPEEYTNGLRDFGRPVPMMDDPRVEVIMAKLEGLPGDPQAGRTYVPEVYVRDDNRADIPLLVRLSEYLKRALDEARLPSDTIQDRRGTPCL